MSWLIRLLFPRYALALTACRLLKAAYDEGEESHFVDWDDVDGAYRTACEALGVTP